jgi:hypothetical protein
MHKGYFQPLTTHYNNKNKRFRELIPPQLVLQQIPGAILGQYQDIFVCKKYSIYLCAALTSSEGQNG